MYFSGKKLHDADPKTAEIVEDSNNNYLKDKKYVFDWSNKIVGADPASLEPLDSMYSKDKNSVFRNTEKVVGVNLDGFKVINSHYCKDSQHVYFEDIFAAHHTNKIIQGADPKTFRHLADHYSADKDSVFFRELKLEGSDPKTFKYTDYKNSYDKNYRYKAVELSIDEYTIERTPLK